MTDLSALVNKTVDFTYRGARLSFDLSHALFSSFAIDTGTRLLLKEIAHDEVITSARTILDSGCGTGIIGISMAASCPNATVVMRDRDLLACEFAERNCWRNGLPVHRLGVDGSTMPAITKRIPRHKNNEPRQAEIKIAPGLLGEDDEFGRFGAVLSNLPAKAGPGILERFIRACDEKLLEPGGRLAFVIVNTLADMAETWRGATNLLLIQKTAAAGHTVFILEKPSDKGGVPHTQPASAGKTRKLDAGDPYVRTSAPRRIGRFSEQARGFWGLPEFDTNSFATDLAIEALEKATRGNLVRDIFIHEPGIGLTALWARLALGPERIHVLSRDLVSIKALGANAGPGAHGRGELRFHAPSDRGALPDSSLDAILWFPDEIPGYDFISRDWEFIARTAKKGAAIVIVASPTIVGRFDKARPSGIHRIGDSKKKSFSALLATKSL